MTTTRIYPNLSYLADENGHLRIDLLPINDTGASQTELWSAYKTYARANELQAQIDSLSGGSGAIDDTLTSISFTWSSDKISTELGLKESIANKNQINGYVGLDGTGIITLSLIPDLTASKITDFDTEVDSNSSVVANTAKITNATHTGDVTGSTVLTISNNAVTLSKLVDFSESTILGRVSTGTGDPEILTTVQARNLLNVQDGATANNTDAYLLSRANHTDTQAATTVSYVNTTSGLVATDIQAAIDELNSGLGTASLLDAGVINGVATLDGTGKVFTSQLPSYVDDVLEYADFASLPVTGEASKVYVTLDNNLTYRWSGSAYVEISPSLALGTTSSTAYRGDYGNTAYTHSLLTTGNPHAVTSSDVGLANVDNTSDLSKPISTATQTALNNKQALDAELTAIAGLVSSANQLPLFTGSGTASLLPVSTYVQGLLADTDAPTIRTSLKAIGSDATGITGASEISNIVALTQANYDAIVTPDAGTIYNITDAAEIVTEGTFTPTLRTLSDATEPTYTTQTGKYIKIGKKVTVICRVTASSTIATGTGSLEIHGLPFVSDSGYYGIPLIRQTTLLGITSGLAVGYLKDATGIITIESDGAGNTIAYTDIQNGSDFMINMTYFTT